MRIHRIIVLVTTLVATLAVAVAVAVAWPSSASWPTVAQQPEYVTLAGSNGANDQIPHGMPSYWSQYGGSVVGWKNTPCYGQTGSCGYNFSGVYGQLYTPATGNPQKTAKVEICNLQEWLLDKSSVWHSLFNPATEKIGGAYWHEPFSSPVMGADYDYSVPNCLIITSPPAGYLYHSFYNRRAPVDPSNITGVVGAAEIRFLPGSYSTSGSLPNLIYDTGVDFENAASGGSTHSSGEGRFETVTTAFRWVFYSDLTINQLHAGLLPPMSFDPATMN